MTADEMKSLADAIMASVKGYVDNAVRAAEARAALSVDKAAWLHELRGELAQMVESMPKPKDGEPGKDSDPAAVAEAAKGLIAESVAAAVAQIPVPKDGTNGVDAVGKRGKPGLDAAQLEIMSDVDISRSYAKRTWARIDGGLWRAAAQTVAGEPDPVKAGWECMVDGIKGIEFLLDSETREVSMIVEKSSGDRILRTVEFPMMLWRGTHELGKEYAQGDSVHSDGSGWVADCKTSGIPGASPDWKLIAKRGRDFRPPDRATPKDEPVRFK